MMGNFDHYWLLNWIDANSIANRKDAEKFLSNSRNFFRMKDLAESWWETTKVLNVSGINLVAGAGLNLTGPIGCPGLGCRKKQVDILFRHAWHYFDKIFLPDAAGEVLLTGNGKQAESSVIARVLTDIELVLYLKKIEALELIAYYPRQKLDTKEYQSFLTKPLFQKIREGILGTILENLKYKFNKKENHSVFNFKDPFDGLNFTIIPEQNSRDKSKHKIENDVNLNEKNFNMALAEIEIVVDERLQYLIEDINTAKTIKGTLGSIIEAQSKLSNQLHLDDNLKNNAVAFQLRLPALLNVPIKELIKIRLHEQDSFLRFRDSLIRASREYFRHGVKVDNSTASTIAESIRNDLIEPELRKLKDKLRAARRTLGRKIIVSASLGEITTTCGLILDGSPSVIGLAGLGTMLTGTGGAIAKYLDDSKDFELSDMYFLWKALKHAKH